MKKLLLCLLFLLPFAGFAQSINDYQYVIVPAKFDFLKVADKYRLNTTSKLLLEKYGFKSFLSTDTLPAEATQNRCAILYASLSEDNSFFATKIKLVLKDCTEKVVFETDFGSSREKDFHVAYNQALREAFKSFDRINYKYNGKQYMGKSETKTAEPVAVTGVAEVKSVASASVPVAEPVQVVSSGALYAQPITNGFQLINTEPKVVYKIYTTSVKDFFIATKGELHGVFFAKGNSWFFEYYQDNQLISESVAVKF
ncbi:hypothetical protein [Flavobacterium sp.]|uniref:hypothetical protein n=1 Tax=Flavobacterium sp. TaxID=239 RepID=UPI002FDED109